MADHSQDFPIRKMSQVFNVSTSGYYRWLGAAPSKRSQQNQQLTLAMAKLWERSRRSYGAPRIHQGLLRQGWQVSLPRVARLMRKAGMASRIRPKWIRTTDSSGKEPVAANLLMRNFNPSKLGQVWVSDITYLPGEHRWYYLTTVMDLCDRKVLGWSVSTTMEAEQTTIAAFNQAVAVRRPGVGMLFHSDRGSQYADKKFRNCLADYQVCQSMSRKGNCWDNAPAESFFKTLKYEAQMPPRFVSYSQVRRVLFDYIECWYNTNRLHSALGYKTPAEIEQLLTKQAA